MEQRKTPALAYRLWNPKAAAAWGFLFFSPAFGAWLHALNWREIGDPKRARANMIWVWVTLGYLLFNAGTLLVTLPESVDVLARVSGMLFWLAWYWSQGRVQVDYVKSIGDDYERKGWARPVFAAVLAVGLYFAVCMALVYAVQPSFPETRDPVELAAWVEPRILKKWHDRPALKDATIQKVVLSSNDSTTFIGTVDATFAGKPERFALTLVISDDRFEWKLKTIKDVPTAPQSK